MSEKKKEPEPEAKRCPGCGRCLECGGPQVVPMPYPVPYPQPVAPYRPWNPYPGTTVPWTIRPYYGTISVSQPINGFSQTSNAAGIYN